MSVIIRLFGEDKSTGPFFLSRPPRFDGVIGKTYKEIERGLA